MTQSNLIQNVVLLKKTKKILDQSMLYNKIIHCLLNVFSITLIFYIIIFSLKNQLFLGENQFLIVCDRVFNESSKYKQSVIKIPMSNEDIITMFDKIGFRLDINIDVFLE